MNDRRLEKKVRQDAVEVKEGINTLVKDSAARLGRVDNNVAQAAENLSTWVDEGVTKLGHGVEKLTGEAKETLASTAATVKKDVGHGLSQYNSKAQQMADKVPGDFGHKTARYPWVAISIALTFGFLLGIIVKPGRHPQALYQI